MTVLKTFQTLWMKRGIQLFIYLNSILLVAPNKNKLQIHLKADIRYLLKAGFKIYVKSSSLQLIRIVNHLGLQLNFEEVK